MKSYPFFLFLFGNFFYLYPTKLLAQIPLNPNPVNPETPLQIPQPIDKPQIEIPPAQITPSPSVDILATVKIKEFDFINNTAFSDTQLNELVKDFLNQEITFADLIKIEEIITNYYVSQGYINSGAVIEAGQTLAPDNATVKVTIIEGGIEEIKVTGTRRLNPNYIRSRIGLAVQTPLNQKRLLEGLQLLQLDPQIQTISTKLSPGIRPNLSVLEIEVTEADTFNVDIFVNNGRNPSVGSVRRGIFLEQKNLFGIGDDFNITYNNTDGSNAVDLSYTIPASPHNTTIRLAGGYSSSEVIDRLFNDIEITGNYNYYELSLRQPLIQNASQEFAIGLTLSRQESRNFLEGEGFPLSVGADNSGKVKISAIRFFQDYIKRNPNEVIAFNSQFSFGIDAFDTTINDNQIPDSSFFSWRGQAQYVKLLAQDTLFIVRSDIQLATEPLLALEQISFGGLGSVRGYPQDFLLTDNGFLLSVETRFPILKVSNINGLLQLTPFIDMGVGWNNGDFPNPNPNTIIGAGVGLLWQMEHNFTARFDWGIPLVNVDIEKDSWNANGLYFNLVYGF